MLSTLIQAALNHRYIVLAVAVVLAALGVWSFQQQKIDAYPDISGQMVQIITEDPSVLKTYDSFIEAMVGPK